MANMDPSERKIQKVPPLLREVKHNSGAYDPKVVSLGPYHHGNPEFQLCQYAKNLTLQMFVDGSGQSVEFFQGEVCKILSYARSCYAENSTYTDDYLLGTMILDACFLIYYMRIADDKNRGHLNKIDNFLGRLVLSMVKRDMFLVENQLPFQVVMLLINLRYGNTHGEEAVSRFLHQTIWGHYDQQAEISADILQQQIRNIHEEHPPLHILEAFRRVLVWDDSIPTNQVTMNLDADRDNIDIKKLHKPFRSATDLKAKGIYFKPSEKKSLRNINFESFPFHGELELPIWFVSSFSKVFFLNMIAYELSPDNPIVDTTVISYLTFMKSLIEKASDVKELREKRILITTLGSDEDVVRMYRDLDTFEMDELSSFMEVKQRIQEHYDSKTKTWKAELIHAYLSSPWSIIAWVAAFILLILTFLQTYFTIAK